jgi:hypothetical protein
MPVAPPTSCMTPFCSGHSVPGSHRCIDCTAAKANPLAEEPIKKSLKRRNQSFYGKKEWRINTRLPMLAYNPQCQELEHGIQCTNPAKVLHHLVDPSDRPDLAFSPSNIVCLCLQHQNRGLRGDDGKANYVPTKWKVPGTHELIAYEHKQTASALFKFWIGG